MLLTAFIINSLPLNNFTWEFVDLEGNIPFKLEATASTGYVDVSSIEKFDEFGLTVSTVSVIRNRIDVLFQATTFEALTLAEKEVVSKWFVALKIDRDTVHSTTEQEDNAKELARLLSIENIFNTASVIKDAEPSEVTMTVEASSSPSTALGWLDLNRKSTTGDQSGIVTGTDLIMDESRGNGIDYDASTGIVSLKANKVYKLFASFAMFSLLDNTEVTIQWVKSDNAELVAGHETRIREPESTSNGNNSQTIEVIYKPTIDTNVKLRCTNYSGSSDTITMYWERSMATVIELR